MGLVVHLGQMLKVQPRIDLGGGDAGVAQQLLHGAQVAAGLQQMAGERVAQHVRVHGRGQPRALAALAQPQPDGLRRDACAAPAQEQRAIQPRRAGWAKGLLSYAIIALVIVLMCLILYLFLSQGERIIRKIGTSGSIVINKMVAFFTFCVGVQIVVTGIAKLFNLHV